MQNNLNTPARANHRALLGSTFVNIILATSLVVSVSYWFVLSGLESNQEASLIWTIALYSVIALGVCAELTKKVAISLFRHKGLWLGATVVSILTIMGSLAITENNKQAALVKASDSYKSAQARSESALNDASKYAYAASYNLPQLEQQLADVVDKRAKRKMRYATYLQQKEALNEKINAKRSYDSALSMNAVSSTAMASGGSASNNTSANPLLDNIATGLGLKAVIIINMFYLAVTILLEYAALFVGGKVEQIKKEAELTKAELLDMQNKEFFGVSISELWGSRYKGVLQAENDQQEAENEVQQLRKNNRDNAGATAQKVGAIRGQSSEYVTQAHTESRPFMGFVNTDNSTSKKPLDSGSTEHTEVGNGDRYTEHTEVGNGDRYTDRTEQADSDRYTDRTEQADSDRYTDRTEQADSDRYTDRTEQADSAEEEYTAHDIDRMRAVYAKTKAAKNGDSVRCPVCELQYNKSRNKIFCNNKGAGNHSDLYKNLIKPERKIYEGKGSAK